jgi:hypothetical protein
MPRGGRKTGADTHRLDGVIVPWLNDLCRLAQRERGWSKFQTIRNLVESIFPVLGGASINAATHRLYQKMKSGRYKKVAFPANDPRAHWSKYTMAMTPLKRQRRSKSK